MITCLLGRVIKLWSHDHIYNIIQVTRQNFAVDVMDRNCDVITFTSNTFIFRRPTVANFADIIKIVNMFVKTT